MPNTNDLKPDNTNKFNKNVSPLKNMLNRMKFNVNNNNLNQFKSPTRNKNEIILNETGVFLTNNPIIKTSTTNSHSKLKLNNNNSLGNLNNKFNNILISNKRSDIVNSN
jgi:hypothetical protein